VVEAVVVAKQKQQPVKRMIGRFIVADPAICHGQPTFRGTRILVADVLEQVAAGVAWETIVFRDHSAEYAAPEYVLDRA
jgi:hypothetical protein